MVSQHTVLVVDALNTKEMARGKDLTRAKSFWPGDWVRISLKWQILQCWNWTLEKWEKGDHFYGSYSMLP